MNYIGFIDVYGLGTLRSRYDFRQAVSRVGDEPLQFY